MRATHVILIAAGVFTLGRWAHNKTAANVQTVAALVFLLFAIGFLDQGRTEEIAQGFAWLVLLVALLSDDSPVGPVLNLISGTTGTTTE